MVMVAGGGSRGTGMLRHVPRAAGVRPGRGTVLGRRTPDQDEVCVVWSAATRACDNDRTLNLPHPTLWVVRAVSATLRAAGWATGSNNEAGMASSRPQRTAACRQQTRGRHSPSSRMPKLGVRKTATSAKASASETSEHDYWR